MSNSKTLSPLLTTPEVAEILGVPVTTLYSWRTLNKGPRAMRVGKFLRWRESDVQAWLDRQAC